VLIFTSFYDFVIGFGNCSNNMFLGFFFTSLFVFPDTSQAVFHVLMHINYHVSFPLDNHNTPEYKWLWNETFKNIVLTYLNKNITHPPVFHNALHQYKIEAHDHKPPSSYRFWHTNNVIKCHQNDLIRCFFKYFRYM
jgi:hypothetical protein